MRWKAVLLIGSLTPLTGCNLAYYAGHNFVNEPVSRLDEQKLIHRLKSDSRTVWREICRQFPTRTFTDEFADGFTDGYADLLENGGTPGPPAIPPLRYRRANYLTPQGQPLIRDYMIGFQYGAEVAAATGKRQFLTVPVLLPEHQNPDTPPLNVTRYPTPPETSTDVPGSIKPKALDSNTAPKTEDPIKKLPLSGQPAQPEPKPIAPPNPNPSPLDVKPMTPHPKAIPIPSEKSPSSIPPGLDLPKINIPKIEALPASDIRVKPASGVTVPSVYPSMPDVYLPEPYPQGVIPPASEMPQALPPVPDPPAPMARN